MRHPINFAFLISSSKVIPAWELNMLNNLMASEEVVISAFVVSNKTIENKESIGLKIFRKFENWWFRSMPNAFEKVPLPEKYNEIRIVEEADHHKLESLKLDVIYRSCLIRESQSIEAYSKYGIWHFIFGNGRYYNSEPCGFWEVMDNVPEIGSNLLVKLSNDIKDTPIYNGTTSTVPYSVKNTLNNLGWKSSSFLPYRIRELVSTGGGEFLSNYKKKADLSNENESVVRKKSPGNFNILRLFIRNGFRYLIKKISGTFQEKKFTISFSQQRFDLNTIDLIEYRSFKLPKGTFWADPFIIEKEGTTYIFFEEYSYPKEKAHISVMEIREDGTASDPRVVLDRPYHLSYPFIFDYEGEVYMIPETSAQRTVELYRCTNFPWKWEFVKNLMSDTILIDATLVYHQNIWWLFGNSLNHPSVTTNDQLFLYYSDSPLSTNWKLHSQSPVATLLSNSRPAGKIFHRNGKLYRPAQNNSSRQYGYALKLNEIEVLNEEEYQEKEVHEILPERGNKFTAIHTINFTDKFIVIDNIQ